MPKQNRPQVRDGRIQAPKKRTDRSYLRPSSGATEIVPIENEDAGAEEVTAAPVAAAQPAAPVRAGAALAAAPAAAGKLPTAVRALQQQGVRKRSGVDLGALARRDTNYAYHELRRIAILATMVVVTLVVLWFVLR